MDNIKQPNRFARLVGLKMSNQMPASGASANLLNLGLGFLQSVFTNVSYATGYCFLYTISRMSLTDSHKSYLTWSAFGSDRRPN